MSNLIPKECIFSILKYLNPNDLIQCSYLSKEWYQHSLSNRLWFTILVNRLPKNIERSAKKFKDPRFNYQTNISYKKYYLQIVDKSYKSFTLKMLKDLLVDCLNFKNLCIYYLICIPFLLLIIEFIIIYDLYSFLNHKMKDKYDICLCHHCYDRLFNSMLLAKSYLHD